MDRGHWQIEALHHIRDVTYGEDASQVLRPVAAAPAIACNAGRRREIGAWP